jgi:hypothetical protein
MELEVPALSVDQVLATIERFGGIAEVLERSTHAERAALYTSMGVTALDDPVRNEVRVGVDPVASTVVSEGGLEPPPTCVD